MHLGDFVVDTGNLCLAFKPVFQAFGSAPTGTAVAGVGAAVQPDIVTGGNGCSDDWRIRTPEIGIAEQSGARR